MMPGMIHGYARVSTDGRSVAAQVAALQEAEAATVWRAVASGAQTERAQLRKALAVLEAGDVLLVTPLDRLERSTRDLPTRWRPSPAKGPGFAHWPTHGPTRRRRTGA